MKFDPTKPSCPLVDDGNGGCKPEPNVAGEVCRSVQLPELSVPGPDGRCRSHPEFGEWNSIITVPTAPGDPRVILYLAKDNAGNVAVLVRRLEIASECSASQYLTAARTNTSDRVCQPVTACDSSTQFETAPPTHTSDRACTPYTVEC